MWQRYVMEAEYLTNFIPKISALNSKHFIYYQLNSGRPSVGQTTWWYRFQLVVQAFFAALKNSFNNGTHQRNYMPTPMYLHRPILANNISKLIYWSGPSLSHSDLALQISPLPPALAFPLSVLTHLAGWQCDRCWPALAHSLSDHWRGPLCSLSFHHHADEIKKEGEWQ